MTVLGVLLVVVLFAPTFASPIPAAATILTAPYHGTVVGHNRTFQFGCGNATLLPGPHFSLATGFGGFASRTNGSPCANGINEGVQYVALHVKVPVAFATPGPHRIFVNGTLRAHLTESIVPGTCHLLNTSSSSCSIGANQSVHVDAFLDDQTNGSRFPATSYSGGTGGDNFTSNYSYCASRVCSSYFVHYGGASFGAFSLQFTGVWSSTHRYVLFVELLSAEWAGVAVSQARLVHAHAIAGINAATGGNGFTLTSITIT